MRRREWAPGRFWSKVEVTDTCWLWRGAVGAGGRAGYGVFALDHRHKMYAHRYAYQLYRGPIPVGLVIDHRCGNALCVNPDHLEAVTVEENGHRGRPVGAMIGCNVPTNPAQAQLF